MKALKFATVINEKIVGITDAFPEHDLLQNQFPLTEAEYKLLQAVKDISEIDGLMRSITEKLIAVNITSPIMAMD